MFELSQITQVFDLSEVDLMKMLDVSVRYMDNNVVWSRDDLTHEEKMQEQLDNITKRFNTQQNVFAFKRTVNGTDVSFNLGSKRADGYYDYYFALVNTINGSRSWIYDERITPQQTQFLVNNDFKGILLYGLINSDTLKHQLKKYRTLDNVTIYENDYTFGNLSISKVKFNGTKSES